MLLLIVFVSFICLKQLYNDPTVAAHEGGAGGAFEDQWHRWRCWVTRQDLWRSPSAMTLSPAWWHCKCLWRRHSCLVTSAAVTKAPAECYALLVVLCNDWRRRLYTAFLRSCHRYDWIIQFEFTVFYVMRTLCYTESILNWPQFWINHKKEQNKTRMPLSVLQIVNNTEQNLPRLSRIR